MDIADSDPRLSRCARRSAVGWAAIVLVAAFLTGLAGCGRRALSPSEAAPPEPTSATPQPRSRPRGAFITYSQATRVISIGNGYLRRKLWLHADGKGLTTASLIVRTATGNDELLSGLTEEFRLRAGGRDWIGFGGDLQYVRHETEGEPSGTQRLRVLLRTHDDSAASENDPLRIGFQVAVIYEVRVDVPLIRKWLEVTNTGKVPLHIEGVTTERLALRPPTDVFRWRRDGSFARLSPPVEVVGDGGLLWLRASPSDAPGYLLGLIDEAPATLKQVRIGPSGALDAGLADGAPNVWLQPEESMTFPAVYLWIEDGGDVSKANAALMALLQEARRAHNVAQDDGPVYILDGDVRAADLSALPPNSLVSIPYAWQSAWDPDGPGPEALRQAAETIRSAGLRVGLWVPAAWIPQGSRLADNDAWLVTGPDGASIPATWRGRPGMIASFASDYAILAYQSLEAIAEKLDLDGLLLDGPLDASATAGGETGKTAGLTSSRWTIWTRFLSTLDRLKRERPQMSVGVSADTYDISDGFDAALYPVAFLWTRAAPGDDATPGAGRFWRAVRTLKPDAPPSF